MQNFNFFFVVVYFSVIVVVGVIDFYCCCDGVEYCQVSKLLYVELELYKLKLPLKLRIQAAP